MKGSRLLEDLLARVAPCFARRETRLTCRDMVHGLLAELDDHNCWTMAEAAGHPGPYRMQHLLSRGRCDDQQIVDAVSEWVTGHLAGGQDGNGSGAVLIVDETADAKSSADCAGAARQYSGTLGGIAQCQVAVTLTYATRAGHALIGRARVVLSPDGGAPGHDLFRPDAISSAVPETARESGPGRLAGPGYGR